MNSKGAKIILSNESVIESYDIEKSIRKNARGMNMTSHLKT